MADWKYIMLQVGDVKVPILFPGTMAHSDMADVMARYPFDAPAHVVSAGGIPALQVIAVEGGSTTLRISVDPEDAGVINTYPYNHGREATIPMDDMIGLRFCQLMMEKLNA